MKKNIIKDNKKAEMSSAMLVTIILLTVGFLILFVFVSDAIAKPDIDRQVCHQSVVLRGTLPDTLSLKDLPSLKCKTRKMCITDKIFGKGECESLGEDFDTLKISKDKEKAENDIKKILADELVDCWSMMGQGKIQVFKRETFSLGKTVCVICSRINFDNNVEMNTISGMTDYLLKHKISNNDETYWQFLTRNGDFENLYAPETADKNTILNFEIPVSEKAVIYTESDKTVIIEFITSLITAAPSVAIGAKTGAVIGSLSGPIGAGVGFIVGGVVGGTVGALIGYNSGDTISDVLLGKDYYSGIYLADYDTKNIDKLKCDVIKNIP